MRTHLSLATCAVLALSALAFGQSGESQPNFIFMLSDDQGYGGLSIAMHPKFEGSRDPDVATPHIAKLAEQGMRFSAAYAPASVCAPTRMSLMNGRNPAVNKWTKAGPSVGRRGNPKLLPPHGVRALPGDQITIGEALQSAGYATAHFGKWHLRSGGPGKHGFDVHDGETGNEEAYKHKGNNPVDIVGMCKRAEKFMRESKDANKPFFVQLSWYALHVPNNASNASLEKYKSFGGRRKGQLALSTDLDNGVGRIMDAVDQLGIAENTYVIYMSDNGAGNASRRRRSPGLAGGKGSVWEGGIRVPLIIRGPGVEANSWCHETVVGYDFYPTYCELARVDLPAATKSSLAGGSMVQLLQNSGEGKVARSRDSLVFHFPHYQTDDGPHSAIISNNMKLLYFYEDEKSILVNLEEDIREQHDLSAEQTTRTDQLRSELMKYLSEVKAQMPIPNPDYDPSKPTTAGQRRRRRRAG